MLFKGLPMVWLTSPMQHQEMQHQQAGGDGGQSGAEPGPGKAEKVHTVSAPAVKTRASWATVGSFVYIGIMIAPRLRAKFSSCAVNCR